MGTKRGCEEELRDGGVVVFAKGDQLNFGRCIKGSHYSVCVFK